MIGSRSRSRIWKVSVVSEEVFSVSNGQASVSDDEVSVSDDEAETPSLVDTIVSLFIVLVKIVKSSH